MSPVDHQRSCTSDLVDIWGVDFMVLAPSPFEKTIRPTDKVCGRPLQADQSFVSLPTSLGGRHESTSHITTSGEAAIYIYPHLPFQHISISCLTTIGLLSSLKNKPFEEDRRMFEEGIACSVQSLGHITASKPLISQAYHWLNYRVYKLITIYPIGSATTVI